MSGTAELLGRFEVGQDTEELYAKFTLKTGNENLFAKFEIQDSEDLFAKFEAQATADLFTKFEIQDSEDLYAKFEAQATQNLFAYFVTRFTATKDLFAEFRATVHFSGTPRNLYSKFFVGVDATAELYAKFEAQATRDLFAYFVTRFTATKDLFAEFRPVVHFAEGWADKKAVLLVVRPGSADLFAEFISRQSGSVELFSEAIIRQETSVDRFAEAIIRQETSVDLFAEFIVRQSGSVDLPARFMPRRTATKELFAKFYAMPNQELYAKFTVRQERTLALGAILYVRHPTYQWTTRRYLNGVVDTPEKLIGDAKLEYVVEGVMEDIQGFLAANRASYSDWSDITLTPVLIRRATTYGVVAALYARHSRTFKSRVITTVAPVNVTTIGDDERAMNYWQDKMDTALANYLSILGSPIIWVSTSEEDPVFTMADIPTSEWDPGEDLVEWHRWLGQQVA